MNRLLLAVLLAFIVPTTLFGQIDFRPGFVVQNTGDTTKGWVAYRTDKKNQQQCFFRAERKGEVKIFMPGEIAGYGIFGNKCYESLKFPLDSPVKGYGFARVLAQGALRLCNYGNFYLVNNGQDWITLPFPQESEIKGNGKTIVMRDQRYIGLLNNEMDDCIDKSKRFRFSEDEITSRVTTYNKCKKPSIQEMKLKPALGVSYRLLTGYQLSKIKYDFVNKFILSNQSVNGGLGFEFSLPRKFDRIFFNVDAVYVNAKYNGYLNFIRAGDPVHRDIELDVTYLKIPFGFKYHFKGGKVSPYISAGFSWSGALHTYTKATETRNVQNAPAQSVYENEYPIKNTKGYWISGGLSVQLRNSAAMFFELRQDGGEGYLGSEVENDSKLSSSGVICGIRF